MGQKLSVPALGSTSLASNGDEAMQFEGAVAVQAWRE